MNASHTYSQSRWRDWLDNLFFRFVTKKVPARWFLATIPSSDERSIGSGKLRLEIVSHCWNYSHLLTYHLSSFVNYPPTKIEVTATVFYSKEDKDTQITLNFFGEMNIQNVSWNWQPLPKEQLFRRSIGRNKAALATKANWIWFADCDLIFHKDCLNLLGRALQGRNDILLYPSEESVTPLLAKSNPLLSIREPRVIDIDTTLFSKQTINRATGAYQIVHGDVARTCGYCKDIRVYQAPVDHWSKTYEDRTYRWLLQTQGKSIDVPGIYRIRHISKGRYMANTLWASLRSYIRLARSKINERKNN